jgi:hypothetical protein
MTASSNSLMADIINFQTIDDDFYSDIIDTDLPEVENTDLNSNQFQFNSENYYDNTNYPENLKTTCSIEDLYNEIENNYIDYENPVSRDNLICNDVNTECRLEIDCSHLNINGKKYKSRGPKDFNCKCTESKGCFWTPQENFHNIRCMDMALRG